MMNEQLHRIMDLCLELENGVTHAVCNISTHVQSITVYVWEGEELTDETQLHGDYAYYDGELKNEQKIRDIIQALEELRDGI